MNEEHPDTYIWCLTNNKSEYGGSLRQQVLRVLVGGRPRLPWERLSSKQDDQSAALEALRHAAKTSDNQVLLENIDRLVNGKVKHFSNSGFGDTWYVLALEEPKVKNQRQMRAF